MIDLIEKNREQIEALCRKYSVKRLELFGSAASGKFDQHSSDVDFFVEFFERGWEDAAERWFGLLDGLEQTLGRKVDLVSVKMVDNPYFLEVANRHRIQLYAA